MRAVRRLTYVAERCTCAFSRLRSGTGCAFVAAPQTSPQRTEGQALRAGSASFCGSETSAGGLRSRTTDLDK